MPLDVGGAAVANGEGAAVETPEAVADDDEGEPLVEFDPSGRYGRYGNLLGFGSAKKVYLGYDNKENRQVAWNQIRLNEVRKNSGGDRAVQRCFSEVKLLRDLRHECLISLYHVWLDKSKGTLYFITELCPSGNLREFREKNNGDLPIERLKRWCKQILVGLEYIHKQNPCIIHRDINCSNIFYNEKLDQVKIGDLGLATIVDHTCHAHTILGTPEFMAPELYQEDYTELVDIYAFGMCILEMVTIEIPFKECKGLVAQLYKKVTSNERPASLSKVSNPEVKAFIERCLGEPNSRPSATELLNDSFFHDLN